MSSLFYHLSMNSYVFRRIAKLTMLAIVNSVVLVGLAGRAYG
ncbi:hypothetical protein MOTHE_c09780 [Moorella thermoacetica]|nr:hypothetical protein MOTHE_c09780 [Moorella thermoacetica]AKX96422.1 hypothetical protein MOTHA_c10670 [Moorella thermoacetica]OIQ57592.1 hypothetical protein MOCA_00080 [Moorella thermoacetica]OIQ61778.1 hypothetical protein MTIN_13590 [Moorella thermoacetica]QDA00236.1 hypothetical protein MothHH_01086 [Moorella thermoacetica]